MNRLKKELVKRNIKMERDLPFLPFNQLQSIVVDSQKATVTYYYLSDVEEIRLSNVFNKMEVLGYGK